MAIIEDTRTGVRIQVADFKKLEVTLDGVRIERWCTPEYLEYVLPEEREENLFPEEADDRS